jgi:hypothetical protein
MCDLGLITATERDVWLKWFDEASRQSDAEQDLTRLRNLARRLGYKLVKETKR